MSTPGSGDVRRTELVVSAWSQNLTTSVVGVHQSSHQESIRKPPVAQIIVKSHWPASDTKYLPQPPTCRECIVRPGFRVSSLDPFYIPLERPSLFFITHNTSHNINTLPSPEIGNIAVSHCSGPVYRYRSAHGVIYGSLAQQNSCLHRAFVVKWACETGRPL